MPKHVLQKLVKFNFLAILTLLAFAFAPCARAEEPAAVVQNEFQLAVTINGQPTEFLSRFTDLGDGRFAAPASELRELGIRVPEDATGNELIALETIPSVSYIYDEAKQSIALEITDEHRVPKSYDARGEIEHVRARGSDYGSVFNYSVYAAASQDTKSSGDFLSFNGVNLSYESRLLSPMGVLSQTGIVGTTLADDKSNLRLETTYTFSDDENLLTWRAGDVLSGGLDWTRPVRLGGAQVQRTFSMRPDLVTTPLPAVSGSAAVPSTVDVFVNGVKSHSQQVAAGPFHIDNVPSISGAGTAQVVTTDAAGRQSVQTLSFYTSPELLTPGLYDFSMETGVARQGFGHSSFDYDTTLLGSASLRSGLTDWVTAEAHGEGGGGLFNIGAGLVARVGDLGIVTGALSGSTSDIGEGYQVYGSFETRIGPVHLNARSQHALDNYQDLAALTGAKDPSYIKFASLGSGAVLTNRVIARAVDSLTLSTPIEFDNSAISATFIRHEADEGAITQLFTATYTRPLIYDANLSATGYVDIDDTKNIGVYVGVSMPLGDNTSASGGISSRGGDVRPYAEVDKALLQDAGSWGWRIRDYEGHDGYRSGSVAHRTSSARMEATLAQEGSRIRGSGEIEGSVAVLGGDVYFANRIDDAFAVVDAHAPGVKVLRQNIAVGETGANGKILIPNVQAYQNNKISIDPLDLPLDAEISSTLEYVAPQYKSGVYIEFDVKQAKPGAIVILKGANGQYIPAGSEVRLEGSDEPFLVGYDGQAFIKGLEAVNVLHVLTPGHECSAQFSFAPTSDVQPTIGPEVCQ